MTNEEFWKKLDLITKRRDPADHITEFMILLKDGYEQNLDVIVSATPAQNGIANQGYLGEKNARFYVCYTCKKRMAGRRRRETHGLEHDEPPGCDE